MNCEGGCLNHSGKVQRVRIFAEVFPGGMEINYCRNAAKESSDSGILVVPIDDKEAMSASEIEQFERDLGLLEPVEQ